MGEKKEDVRVFSLPFQWKFQTIPEVFPTPIIQRKIIIGPEDPLSSLPALPILLFCEQSTTAIAFNDLTNFFFLVKNPNQNISQTHGVSTQNCRLLWGYLCLLQNYELYKGNFRNDHIPYPVPHFPLTSLSSDFHLFLLWWAETYRTSLLWIRVLLEQCLHRASEFFGISYRFPKSVVLWVLQRRNRNNSSTGKTYFQF